VFCKRRLLAILLAATFGSSLITVAAADFEIGGGRIEIEFSEVESNFPRDLTLEWIRNAARAVISYYGRFPVSHLRIRIRSMEGDRIGSGKTFGTEDGGVITIAVGRSTTRADFQRDWMMTHEMVHLAFPSVAEEHHWIEEGLATYVEPIARAQIGNLTAVKVWSDLVRDLPQGLPQPGDRGLDFTPTWGRTYWGGALFCFLADIEIRRQTKNAKGLQDGLRAVLETGGNISADWDLERIFGICDRATGVSVTQELYAKIRAAPHPVDLDELWKKLGIERRDSSVVFRNDAALASVRRAIVPGNDRTRQE
jgi:hypothetical protein